MNFNYSGEYSFTLNNTSMMTIPIDKNVTSIAIKFDVKRNLDNWSSAYNEIDKTRSWFSRVGDALYFKMFDIHSNGGENFCLESSHVNGEDYSDGLNYGINKQLDNDTVNTVNVDIKIKDIVNVSVSCGELTHDLELKTINKIEIGSLCFYQTYVNVRRGNENLVDIKNLSVVIF